LYEVNFIKSHIEKYILNGDLYLDLL